MECADRLHGWGFGTLDAGRFIRHVFCQTDKDFV